MVVHNLLGRQLRRNATIATEAEFAEAFADLVSFLRNGGNADLGPEADRLLRALPTLFVEIESAYR